MASTRNSFRTKKQKIFVYDVTGGDSGAAGAHVLGSLPKNSIITQAWIHVRTTFTSATDAATISLGYTGALTAFEAATAISTGTTWDADVPRVSDAAADGAVANFVNIGTSNVNVIATSAVETITAGKLLLVVEYYVAD